MPAALDRTDDASETVQMHIRTPVRVRALIDQAAEVLGKSRTEFVLDCARERAQDVLLDQRLFQLDERRFAAFTALLDAPPPPPDELRKLLATPAPWEK